MDPHLAEYIAAAAGLHEQTPSGHGFVEGQEVRGTSGGKSWTGTILAVDGNRLHVEIDGGWLAVDALDVIG